MIAMALNLYRESDFVKVVDEQGTELPPVPKTWVGKDLLPEGVKRKSASRSSSQQTPSGPTEPSGNASREDWAKYAVEVKGAKPEDLVDGDGKELSRDELKAKFGTPTGS